MKTFEKIVNAIQNYAATTLSSPKNFLSYIVAVFLISSGFWMAQDSYEAYQEKFGADPSSEEWITYTNTNYGYEISYPESVEFVKLSEINHIKASGGKGDQVVFIGDSTINKSIYTVSAGAPEIGYIATNTNQLKDLYIKHTIPEFVNGEIGSRIQITADDFSVNEILFNDRPAVEVISPIGYSIQVFNKNGDVMNVTGSDYTGATTTSKDRNTRAIMETFRVLD